MRLIATLSGFAGVALSIHGIWRINAIAGELTAAAWLCFAAYSIWRNTNRLLK